MKGTLSSTQTLNVTSQNKNETDIFIKSNKYITIFIAT